MAYLHGHLGEFGLTAADLDGLVIRDRYVWMSMLWEVYWELVLKYGFESGDTTAEDRREMLANPEPKQAFWAGPSPGRGRIVPVRG